jgi:hypothetical protein
LVGVARQVVAAGVPDHLVGCQREDDVLEDAGPVVLGELGAQVDVA